MIFQIKIWNEINFFLIIIFILLQFKSVYLFSLKFLWATDIQNALLLVNWPSQCIAIDHSSIGLKRMTIQLLVNEVWLCVLTSLLHHNTSQVCTATLNSSVKHERLRILCTTGIACFWLLDNIFISYTEDWKFEQPFLKKNCHLYPDIIFIIQCTCNLSPEHFPVNLNFHLCIAM